MLRATSIVRKPAVKADRIADVVVLDHEDRQRRRIALQGRGGLAFLLDLDKPAILNEGDALKLEDGRLIAVEPAPQKLLEIRAENPLRLTRVAWHIGNRHTPAEITADAIYIEDDHVLAEMIRGQGCSLTPVTRAFRPERGAYDHGGHDHGHGHDHGPAGKVNPPHGQPGHVHGPDCGHDHHHEHSHDVLDVKSHKHDHAHDHGQHHDHDHHDHDHRHGHDHGHGSGARHKHDH